MEEVNIKHRKIARDIFIVINDIALFHFRYGARLLDSARDFSTTVPFQTLVDG
jgi:hypothetical protein